MTITGAQLFAVMRYASLRIPQYLDPLNTAMNEFGIRSDMRQAAFLAQIAHESGELRYTSEIADGTAYEGRVELGNTEPGDGPRFKGHGLIQVTGRKNHILCGIALKLDLVAHPELITEPLGAARSAGWFWQSHGCNELADGNMFGKITKTINGGFNGLDERLGYWLAARKAFGL